MKRNVRLEGFKLKKADTNSPFADAEAEEEFTVEILAYDPEGKGDAFWIRTRSQEGGEEPANLVYDGDFNVGFDGTDGKIFIPPSAKSKLVLPKVASPKLKSYRLPMKCSYFWNKFSINHLEVHKDSLPSPTATYSPTLKMKPTQTFELLVSSRSRQFHV